VSPSHEFAKTGSTRNRKNLPPPVPTLSNTPALQTSDGASGRGASFSVFRGLDRLLLLIPSNSCLLFFQTSNNGPKPASNGLFDQVKFHNLQDVAVVFLHLAPLRQPKNAETAKLPTIPCELPGPGVPATSA